MRKRAVRTQSVERDLHLALDQHRFVLHYQPTVNLETGAVTGAEALLRWQRSAHRLVGPTRFVSIAEDCGLIVPIGRWVLREACRQAQAWLQAGLAPGRIAVNVSAVELHEADFLAGVRSALHDARLDPRHLALELTESGLMRDTQQTTAVLRALRDLGVPVAIDDFGTGYSSLSYLLSFPVDEIKIDQSFVHAIDRAAGKAIVSAVIAMGKSLHQRVVAEGIETRAQLAFLRSRHCAEGQGYYFGRPVAAAEFAALLATPARRPPDHSVLSDGNPRRPSS
jgi:EAL domain-containing protein (putative c-di-GMP-specific phosphodiesterase class I)